MHASAASARLSAWPCSRTLDRHLAAAEPADGFSCAAASASSAQVTMQPLNLMLQPRKDAKLATAGQPFGIACHLRTYQEPTV